MIGNDSKISSVRTTLLENPVDLSTLPWAKRDAKGLPSLFHANPWLWMCGILLGTDLLSLYLAILTASQIRHISPRSVNSAYDGIFVVLAVMMAVLFYRKELYPAMGMHYVDELRHIVTSSIVAFVAMIAVTFVFQIAFLAPSLVLIVAGLLNLFFVPLGRYSVRRWMIRLKLWGEPVAIIGDREKARALTDYFTINMQFGIRPVTFLSDPLTVPDRQSPCPALSVCRTKLFVRNLSLKTALVLVDDLNDIDKLVDRYRFIFQRVILIKDQNGSFGLSNLKSLDFLDFLGLQVRNNLLNVSTQFWKRLVDLVASSLALLLLSPFLGLIAALIKLDTGGRIFYRQVRVGRDGRPFLLVKFRTMHQDRADQILKEALKNDPALRQEWDTFQKLKDDPRVTRVGKILRRFSLDELPQLWNIRRGEMSLVGPRPIMLNQRKLYGDLIREYIRVTPGVTGLWQVSGRNETTFARRAELDIEYIERWSPWLDIYIMLKTLKVVLGRDGAY